MTGRRVYPGEDGELYGMQPGDYGKGRDGFWFCSTPNGLLGALAKHVVVEHEDGTVTVSPSILVRGTVGLDPTPVEWHGYLERGVWRTC